MNARVGLILFAILLSTRSFAYKEVPLCSDGKGWNFSERQVVARRADKRTHLLLLSKTSPMYINKKDVDKFIDFRPWILGELNRNSLLNDQVIEQISDTNDRYTGSYFKTEKDSGGGDCLRLNFSEGDVRFLGAVWLTPTEFILSFHVLLTEGVSRRNDGYIHGYRFNMKVSTEFAESNRQAKSYLIEYPQFISDEGGFPEEN